MPVSLAPFPLAELAEWMSVQRVSYVADRMRAGDDEAAALRNADANDERLFPGGVLAPSHDLLRVLDDGRPVGVIWVGPHPQELAGVAYIWDVEVDPSERGRGFGRAAMLLTEEHARSRGYRALALNVFGFNTTARGLYESLGYEPTSLQMRKELGTAEA